MTDKTGGPAFPRTEVLHPAGGQRSVIHAPGMTLRQYYAAHPPKPPALMTHCIDRVIEQSQLSDDEAMAYAGHQHARWAYAYADAMIEFERDEGTNDA